MKQKISGKVIDFSTQEGIEWLKVDVWIKTEEADLFIDSAFTNTLGEFNVVAEDDRFNETDNIYYKVYENNELLISTNVEPGLSRLPVSFTIHPSFSANTIAGARVVSRITRPISFTGRAETITPVIEIRRTPADVLHTPIRINSVINELNNDELKNEIASRINSVANGGQLYFINPLRLLAEVGVELSDEAKSEIINVFENSPEGVKQVYNSLRSSDIQQRVKINITSSINQLS